MRPNIPKDSNRVSGLPIQIKGITKTYGTVTALNRFDLDVSSGEFLTLLGPSGSGKTTLLMILAGFVRPTSGEITFGGRPVVLLPPHRRNVGMVFQNYALFPHMNVFENVAFPLRLRKTEADAVAERVGWALDLVQLAGYGHRRINELSGGQCQRVALARAIVFKPDILLMDEPLSALDKKLRDHMQAEIRALHEQLGITTIYVTHDQREALTMSDRVAVINEGSLMQLDSPRALYERPGNAFVAGFIGESSLIHCKVEGDRAVAADIVLRHNAPPVSTSADFLAVLRPEKLRIAQNEARDPAFNYVSGSVRRISFQGESMLFTVNVAGWPSVLVRHLTNDSHLSELSPGSAIDLKIHPNDVVIVPSS